MNIQTHPNFKSFVEDVQDAETIYEWVGYAISFQEHFDKTTTPSELYDNFENDKLQNFKIDLEKIDRLYYINLDKEDNYKNEFGDQTYHLIARMQYNDESPIYVEIFAKDPYSHQIVGHIYVSRNVTAFMKHVLSEKIRYNNPLIYEFLREDGIYLEENLDDPKLISYYLL